MSFFSFDIDKFMTNSRNPKYPSWFTSWIANSQFANVPPRDLWGLYRSVCKARDTHPELLFNITFINVLFRAILAEWNDYGYTPEEPPNLTEEVPMFTTAFNHALEVHEYTLDGIRIAFADVEGHKS